MKPVNLALVGAGRMGQAHARVLAGVSGCRLVAVADSRAEQAEKLAKVLGARAATRLEDALTDAVDAVIITTPTPTHADVIEAAASAGKAIFVEKPLAESLEAGCRAVMAVERAGAPAQVGFQRRYDPTYAHAKALLDEGYLGRLWGFRGVGRDPGPLPVAYLKTSGGIFLDMGVHDLDSARWLVSEVSEVYATGGAVADPDLADYGLADSAVATLRFANGALGTLELSWRNPYGYDVRAEVIGERGRIHIERDRRLDLNVYDAHGAHFQRPGTFEERFTEAYTAEIAAFIRGLQAGEPLTPTPRDAWYSLRLALAAQHSLESGQPVNVAEFGAIGSTASPPEKMAG